MYRVTHVKRDWLRSLKLVIERSDPQQSAFPSMTRSGAAVPVPHRPHVPDHISRATAGA